MTDLGTRAELHRVLGDERRLAVVDELRRSDRTPSELGELTGTPSNLLAHHLDELERVGVVRRVRSEGDGRRRYVQLASVDGPVGLVVTVCDRAREHGGWPDAPQRHWSVPDPVGRPARAFDDAFERIVDRIDRLAAEVGS